MNINLDSADVMSDGSIIAGYIDTIKKSTDGGANWTDIYTIPGNPTICYRVFVDSRDYIFVSSLPATGTAGGLYRSIDGGANFTKVLAMANDCLVWGMDEDANGKLFIGEYSANDQGTMQIWKSTDSGANWVQKYVTAKNHAGEEHHVHDLRIDPRNGYIYATTGDEAPEEMWRSVDGGENWTDIYNGDPYRLLAISFKGNTVYVGTDVAANEIYSFTDDGTGNPQVFNANLWVLDISYNAYLFSSAEDDKGNIYFGAYYFGATPPDKCGLYKFDGTDWHLIEYVEAANPSGFFGMSRHNRSGKIYCGFGASRVGMVINCI